MTDRFPRAFRISSACAVAIAGVLTFGSTGVHAEQFVLFDAMFTFTKQQADTSTPSKSHFYVKGPMLNAMRPTNWMSPIDYRNGTVHIRTEVIDKPAGSEVTQWILCYIANQGGYGCAGTGTYREKGLYERDTSMTSWWNNTTIMWQAGIKQMDLVMKDSDGSTGFAHLRPDSEKFFPTTMRITMIQVSAGAKYDPSLVPSLPANPDAGASSDGGARDGGTSADSAGGSGGASGSGGAGGGSGGAQGGSGGGETGTGGVSGGSGAGGISGGTGGTSGLGGSGGAVTGTGGSTPGGGQVVGGAGCALVPGAARETSVGSGLAVLGMLGLSALVARRRGRRKEGHDAEADF